MLVSGSAWICPFCCAKEICSTIICHKELPLAVWGFADIPPLLLIPVGTVDGKALGSSHWGYHTCCTRYLPKSEKGNRALERWSDLLKVIPQVCSRTTTEPGVWDLPNPSKSHSSLHFLVVLLTLLTVILLRCGCAVTAGRRGLCFLLDLAFDPLLCWKYLHFLISVLCWSAGEITSFLLSSQ